MRVAFTAANPLWLLKLFSGHSYFDQPSSSVRYVIRNISPLSQSWKALSPV